MEARRREINQKKLQKKLAKHATSSSTAGGAAQEVKPGAAPRDQTNKKHQEEQ